MRRWMWIVLGLVLSALVVVFIVSRQSTQANVIPEGADTVRVERKQLVASISASGSVSPVAQVALNFSTPGTVREVVVNEGQTVRQGDALAALESTELELAAQQAEQALIVQQVAYSQTVSPRKQEVDAARAALNSAQTSLTALTQPDPMQVDIARRQADVANETRYQVELQWNQVKDAPIGGLRRDLLQSQYAQAVLQAQIAELQYDIVAQGGTESQIAAARAQVAQAQSALDRLLADDRTLQLAEAQLRQAELNLALAQTRLEHATLTAPFDGTISEVNIVAGQAVGVSSLQPAIVVADLTAFHIDVGVDEIDVGRLTAGQPAEITVDALPGTPIGGMVDRIAPTARENAGVVSYLVTIAIDPADAPIRAGMSAIVDIITDVRESVLVIPNRFIRIDRNNGRAYVNVKRGDLVEEVEIITGLRNDSESEVVQGLSAGEELVILPNNTLFSFGG
ncbi:MAG TPA: efflux RND transporter periplasmic adaptor subunit [Anaerolineae bacterium]|nr:efflux RND transporter periplasmic adaptor subunit [Anaerolineae bacterium]